MDHFANYEKMIVDSSLGIWDLIFTIFVLAVVLKVSVVLIRLKSVAAEFLLHQNCDRNEVSEKEQINEQQSRKTEENETSYFEKYDRRTCNRF